MQPGRDHLLEMARLTRDDGSMYEATLHMAIAFCALGYTGSLFSHILMKEFFPSPKTHQEEVEEKRDE